MNEVLLQLKISPELHEKIMSKLAAAQKVHDECVERLHKEIETTATPKTVERFRERLIALHERGRRITPLNVVRGAIDAGLKTMDVVGVLTVVAKGVPRGRPTRIGK